mmetsp:Transcript_23661/g.40714  ORF Transcript_23661/g.40714 Transcript_23661/m.40714 type:complete len:175 (+) Transcript_23661:116-640(+)|eukprot:CAMPEP_0196656416 /NCGR_PEP_ID=MMETSP1086-20130531/17016_1 /TAXON_ID=77921 /ORGANISM="Cyanoptyche  gloeocystis , Strain SAG4.97" /LENGTH=174 /DNA_ID=CAMNT_0041989157 /DNA_START=116 /DNA_END=640 /DNA_ORIENTATION=+
MAQTLRPYLTSIRNSLIQSVCLMNSPSPKIERQKVPEIEAASIADVASPELVLNPITISRNENECCLIEPSFNSVRISVKIKQTDDIEKFITAKYVKFLMRRAEAFGILRSTAIPGFDISFLITSEHVEDMYRHKLVDFIVDFIQDIDKDISDLKLALRSRGRITATEFVKLMM